MITTTIVLLAGALPLRMAAIFISTQRHYHTCSMIRSKLPCFPRAVPIRVQRKRGKVSVSKRVDWKKVTQQSTKWEWRDDKNGGKLTWQSAKNSKYENERRGKEEEGTRAREMLEEWHIHQPNNGNQEWCTTRRNRERYDVWRNAGEPRNKNYYTPLQSTSRREDCKDKDPTTIIE